MPAAVAAETAAHEGDDNTLSGPMGRGTGRGVKMVPFAIRHSVSRSSTKVICNFRADSSNLVKELEIYIILYKNITFISISIFTLKLFFCFFCSNNTDLDHVQLGKVQWT